MSEELVIDQTKEYKEETKHTDGESTSSEEFMIIDGKKYKVTNSSSSFTDSQKITNTTTTVTKKTTVSRKSITWTNYSTRDLLAFEAFCPLFNPVIINLQTSKVIGSSSSWS